VLKQDDKQVSFADEQLILVDDDDDVLGYDTKAACHQGDGILHRAFSVFLFNEHGEVLLQRRSVLKPLWPGYWANSCCSHPRRGEQQSRAVNRRLFEELGIKTSTEFVYKFRYQAHYGDIGSEHELCSVYIGLQKGPPDVNVSEIDDWCFMSPDKLDDALAHQPELYTPWLKLEWRGLRQHHWSRIEGLMKTQ